MIKELTPELMKQVQPIRVVFVNIRYTNEKMAVFSIMTIVLN